MMHSDLLLYICCHGVEYCLKEAIRNRISILYLTNSPLLISPPEMLSNGCSLASQVCTIDNSIRTNTLEAQTFWSTSFSPQSNALRNIISLLLTF